jgi:hypothetical protein
MDGEESSAKKDTRGGGIGCRALRLLRERFSLAGMQILAGTPPRVWAFTWYLRCTEISPGKAELQNSTFNFFWPMPVGRPGYLPPLPTCVGELNATFVPIRQ